MLVSHKHPVFFTFSSVTVIVKHLGVLKFDQELVSHTEKDYRI